VPSFFLDRFISLARKGGVTTAGTWREKTKRKKKSFFDTSVKKKSAVRWFILIVRHQTTSTVSSENFISTST